MCSTHETVPVEGGGIHSVEENLQKLFICHHLSQKTRVIIHSFYFFYPLGWYRYSVADPWCLSRIPNPTFFHPGSPDPNFFHPGSRIRIEEFQYFNPKNGCWALGNLIRVVHPGPDPGSGSWLFTHPGSRIHGQKGTESRIRIRNTDF